MDNNHESKKCFCARCFLPIDSEDKVDIEGQNFHRFCSMCCVCRTIPSTIKMFYGHVFCKECFNSHVMERFRGESSRMASNSWWQCTPGSGPPGAEDEKSEDGTSKNSTEEPPKRFICARCLQSVDETHRVTIGNQSFHSQCAKCYFCHKVPSSDLKIYYGQVFCEDCFHRNVLNRNQDNPSEFFKNCFEQWQNNGQFANNMREFMSGNKESAPFIFMMQGHQPPFCRCGTGPQEWYQPNEPRKSVTHSTPSMENSLEDSFEKETDIVNSISINESAKQENSNTEESEKIEKLTKYLHNRHENKNNNDKTWNFLDQKMVIGSDSGWTDLQVKKCNQLNCPKCLWQCGTISVNSNVWNQKLFTDKNKF